MVNAGSKRVDDAILWRVANYTSRKALDPRLVDSLTNGRADYNIHCAAFEGESNALRLHRNRRAGCIVLDQCEERRASPNRERSGACRWQRISIAPADRDRREAT